MQVLIFSFYMVKSNIPYIVADTANKSLQDIY